MTPIAYAPKADDIVAVLLLGCFFLTSLLMWRNKSFVFQLAKDYVLHRERNSIFDTATVADMRSLTLLIIQTCALVGVCSFVFFSRRKPDLAAEVSPLLLLCLYVVACVVYVALKWLIYYVLGKLFFDPDKVMVWFSSYSTLLYYVGFLLFPFTLCMVYLDISLTFWIIIGILLFIIAKSLTLYKWIKLFCDDYCGYMLLIVYFCALEIIPCLMLFRGMVLLNSCLTV